MSTDAQLLLNRGNRPIPPISNWLVNAHVVMGMIPLAPNWKSEELKKTRKRGAGITAAAREMNEHPTATLGTTPVMLAKTPPSKLPVASIGVKMPPTKPDSMQIQKVRIFVKQEAARILDPICSAEEVY